MATDRGAMAVLAAGVQQRLIRVEDARQVAHQVIRFRRRKLILDTLGDIAGADGYRTLRFPAWLVRQDPKGVARTIRQALHHAGYRG